MTHLEKICRVYDECGIIYHIWQEDGYSYLVLVGDYKEEAKQCETHDKFRREFLDSDFMEFDSNGEIASY